MNTARLRGVLVTEVYFLKVTCQQSRSQAHTIKRVVTENYAMFTAMTKVSMALDTYCTL